MLLLGLDEPGEPIYLVLAPEDSLAARSAPGWIAGYAFSDQENCFYVHSATEGRKIDYLRANPRVWGQVIEDLGYMTGECSHAYRSVMFEAHAEFIEDLDEKRRALSLMIDHADPDPEPLKQKLVATADLKQVLVVRLVVDRMSGKHRQ